MRKQFCVIGLGRFGSAVAQGLEAQGNEVLAVDVDQRRVHAIADRVTHAITADTSDMDALSELGVEDFDAVVVAIGENLEASVLTTLHLVELGCKRVIAKANTDDHAHILRRVGANQVVQPERDMGERLALTIGS